MTETSDAAAPVERAGWVRRHAVLLAGALLAVGGSIAVVVTSAPAQATFGWVAYASLEDAVLIASSPVWQKPVFVGIVVAVVGLIVIAAALGYRAGVRRASRAQ
ncbi:MAG: hypothetical protein ABWX65_08100 [Mycetocola sp.]